MRHLLSLLANGLLYNLYDASSLAIPATGPGRVRCINFGLAGPHARASLVRCADGISDHLPVGYTREGFALLDSFHGPRRINPWIKTRQDALVLLSTSRRRLLELNANVLSTMV